MNEFGLVFGGGVVKVFVYILVLEVFDDFGVWFNMIVGMLMGVIFGVFYVSGMFVLEICEFIFDFFIKKV